MDGSTQSTGAVSISTIVLMLGGSAANYLDEASKQQDLEQKKQSLELARVAIDLLVVLEEKTRNNLSADEKATLDATLTQLRLQYVRLSG